MSRMLLVLPLVVVTVSATSVRSADDVVGTQIPPGRVGRVSAIEGHMTQQMLGEQTWADAQANFPITSGIEFRTAPETHAELQLGTTIVAMDGGTTIAVKTLDDENTWLFVEDGNVDVRVRSISPDEHVTVETPNGKAALEEVGAYRVDVSSHSAMMRVVSFDGRADVQTMSTGQSLAADEAVEVNADRRIRSIRVENTPLESWAMERQNHLDESVSARYVSADVPGYEELDAAGAWQMTKDYGAVWVPSKVSADWTPYQDGYWTWAAPWGWTWIDSASWGFAPSHYGRWAFIEGHWAWSPGKRLRHSVYVPAVVGFDGVDPSRFASRHQPPRHWVALGPGEIYRAPYTQDQDYLRRVNRGAVSNEQLAAATWASDEWPTLANIDHVHFTQTPMPPPISQAAAITPSHAAMPPMPPINPTADDHVADAAADNAVDDQGQMVLRIPMIEARRLNLAPPTANTANDQIQPATDRPAIVVSHDVKPAAKNTDPLVHPELEDHAGLIEPLPSRKDADAAVSRERLEVVHEPPLSRPVHTRRYEPASMSKPKDPVDKHPTHKGDDTTNHAAKNDSNHDVAPAPSGDSAKTNTGNQTIHQTDD